MIVRTPRDTPPRPPDTPPRATREEHTPTDTPTEHTTTGKERNTSDTGKPVYIGIIADNEKKVQKKLKKNLEIRKKVVTLLLQLNQTTL